MSRKQSFRFSLHHLLSFMLAWIILAVFYLQHSGQFMWNSQPSPESTLPQIHHVLINNPSLSLHQINLCWNTIFQVLVIGQITHDDALQYTDTSKTLSACITTTNRAQLRSLLSATNLMLQQLLITSSPNSTSSISHHSISYREALVLRRITGVLFHRNRMHKDHEYRNFLQTVHSLLHSPMFQARHLNKTFFNIHISKSGGSSICSTFNNLPFNNVSCPDGAACNYPYEVGGMSCDAMYAKAKPYDMVAKESALDVMDSLHPELCDNFIYLLPFRNPVEKALSYINSVNTLTLDSAYQFYRRSTRWSSAPKTHSHLLKRKNSELECLSKPIIINGISYRRIMHGAEYKGLFTEWFESEKQSGSLIRSWTDLQKVRNVYKSESKKLDIEIDDCLKQKVKEDNEWVYEFVDRDNKVGSRFMVRRNDRQFRYAGFTLSRSSTSNTFTSWLGYGDKYRWPYSAELNPRTMINTQHFVNAVWLMMGIDYVLPLWRFYQSDQIEDAQQMVFGMKSKIWNQTFEDIVQYFTRKGYASNGKEWKYWWFVGHNQGSKHHVKADNVEMTEEDLAMLRKWNAFDIELFKLAQWIANVDIEYLSL